MPRAKSLSDMLREIEDACENGLLSKQEASTTKMALLTSFTTPTVNSLLMSNARRIHHSMLPDPPRSRRPQAKYIASSKASFFNRLVWSDEFEDNLLNLTTWQHEITMSGGGNWEFEYYANNRSNSYVRNGILHIKPTLTAETMDITKDTLDLWGAAPADLCTSNAFYGCQRSGANGLINPIRSSRLRTAKSFSFRYGRLEVRAKLPRGDWLWPAIWLLPVEQQYGVWPASGEIDLVESRGNAAGYGGGVQGGGVDTIASTLHFGPFFGEDGWQTTHSSEKATNGSFATDFHTFGLIWDKDAIQTYIDDPSNVVLDVPIGPDGFWQRGGWNQTSYINPWEGGGIDAPFDQRFYLILNVAAGGTSGYFPDGVDGKPWTDASANAAGEFWAARDQWLPSWTAVGAVSSEMQVDWVRVYQ